MLAAGVFRSHFFQPSPLKFLYDLLDIYQVPPQPPRPLPILVHP